MTTLCEQLESAQAWSLIDKKPVSVYSTKYDAHLVYWNGIAMTRTYALLIISTEWMKMYHTASVKEAAWKEYNRLYRLGAFGHYDWDATISRVSFHSFIGYLTNQITKNDTMIDELLLLYTPQDALMWLDPVSERKI